MLPPKEINPFSNWLFGVILDDGRIFYSMCSIKFDSRGGIGHETVTHEYVQSFNIIEWER